MTKIPVVLLEFVEGGKAIWITGPQGGNVLRIQCTGIVKTHSGCQNLCPHADINVTGDIEICIPDKPKRKTHGKRKTDRSRG